MFSLLPSRLIDFQKAVLLVEISDSPERPGPRVGALHADRAVEEGRDLGAAQARLPPCRVRLRHGRPRPPLSQNGYGLYYRIIHISIYHMIRYTYKPSSSVGVSAMMVICRYYLYTNWMVRTLIYF